MALCHLGNGQLQQFEATSANDWLQLAEKTFRAALACEGKDANSKDPPSLITDQNWWKKRTVPAQPAGGGGTAGAASKGGVQQSKSSTGTKATPATTKPQAVKPGSSKPAPAPARGRQPVKPVGAPVAGRGRGTAPSAAKTTGPGAAAGRGKTVATLGDLKSGGQKQPQKATTSTASGGASKQSTDKPTSSESKPAETVAENQPSKPVVLNEVTYVPRLGLARSLAKQDYPKEECVSLYQEVIKMASHIHDAYIELGDLLSKTEPIKAVDVYSKFPFSDPPSFDDAYLHGEIVRILMKGSLYDDPRLASSMIAMGRALGIGVLDRHVSTLEAKFKTAMLKQVYAGVHGKSVDDPDLQAFFKFKCWT